MITSAKCNSAAHSCFSQPTKPRTKAELNNNQEAQLLQDRIAILVFQTFCDSAVTLARQTLATDINFASNSGKSRGYAVATAAHLRRIDAPRFCRLDKQLNLFGGVLLVKEWECMCPHADQRCPLDEQQFTASRGTIRG
jgi:hypothetical protein